MDAKINASAIARLHDKALKALYITGEAVRTDIVSAQTMPRDNGDMQDNNTWVDMRGADGGVRVITGSPQARRLYYHPEYNFQTVNNPNAGAGWFDPYEDGGEKADFVRAAFAENMRKELV